MNFAVIFALVCSNILLSSAQYPGYYPSFFPGFFPSPYWYFSRPWNELRGAASWTKPVEHYQGSWDRSASFNPFNKIGSPMQRQPEPSLQVRAAPPYGG